VHDKIHQLSVAPLIAEAILNIHDSGACACVCVLVSGRVGWRKGALIVGGGNCVTGCVCVCVVLCCVRVIYWHRHNDSVGDDDGNVRYLVLWNECMVISRRAVSSCCDGIDRIHICVVYPLSQAHVGSEVFVSHGILLFYLHPTHYTPHTAGSVSSVIAPEQSKEREAVQSTTPDASDA
jgi:hypothetical protein